MRFLITGNMGYIGPVLISHLRQAYPGAQLIGLDRGYFAHALTTPFALPEIQLDQQWYGDVRNCSHTMFQGIDGVIHLAAISNDPMGKAFEQVTDLINRAGTLRIARLAREAGVKHFVFASSCSMYGASDQDLRDETSSLDPLTAYARSKVASEQDLQTLASDDFCVTALRFGTACGWSDRLRLDLVLNDFVATAHTTGRIEILSDGTPWRPLIHVEDMSRAMAWALQRETEMGPFVAVNVGRDDWNHQVKDLAKAVADVLPGTDVEINTQAAPDKRSYRVSFAKYRQLAPDHQPQVHLEQAIEGLKAGLDQMSFDQKNFRDGPFMRLNMLRNHQQTGRLDAQLNWSER
ncbi:NAD-dependent epimerase/dehydratase family protein [Magnetococcus sp. PR-3]|uniref:NAD-dependent epimerase/dehydratase family protein n=1 Tax=Magnetococcus sp. PR-3 TaxID=3120355 RepID=UPI002FCE1EC7